MATFTRTIEPKLFRNDVLIISAQDTHAGVAGHLLNTFQQHGFRTKVLVDHRDHERKADEVEESKISIVILSKGFLFSPPLLDKLKEIVDEFSKGRKAWKDRLLLLFYNVEPSHVLELNLRYKNLFEPERFDKWSDALTKVIDLPCFCCQFQRDGDTYEYQCVDEILGVVSELVAPTIGLYPRVKEVMSLLYPGSDDGAHVVGICGVPGIGKKTIAGGVCEIASTEFDKYCFLGKVGEKVREFGSVHLPWMLQSEMVGNHYIKFGSFEEGMTVIKNTFKQMKVLISLDGINCSDSLKAVVKLTDCFGSGSRVLITAQDKCLLESHGIERIYEVKGLDKTSGCQLLCLKAFSSLNMSVKFVDIIDRAETYAAGNPLVLEVIGSKFRGKTVAECEFALAQYERIPIAELIQNIGRENDQMFSSEVIFEENMEYGMPNPPQMIEGEFGINSALPPLR